MKAATVRELRQELSRRSSKDLIELCLRLAKFKKDNKELLTYLLFEAADETAYINSVKSEIDAQFEQMSRKSYYLIKKSVRKILRHVKKYIRYSQRKETEIELLLYFCRKLRTMTPSISRSRTLLNLYDRQVNQIRKVLEKLHEDLQYDYQQEVEQL